MDKTAYILPSRALLRRKYNALGKEDSMREREREIKYLQV